MVRREAPQSNAAKTGLTGATRVDPGLDQGQKTGHENRAASHQIWEEGQSQGPKALRWSALTLQKSPMDMERGGR